MSSGEEACPVCKDWGPGTLALYERGCPRCGSTAQDADLIAWLRRQVTGDLGLAERTLARWPGNKRWLERAADCRAKLALLDRYDEALAGKPAGYDHRTGRASEAQVLWSALRTLADGYLGREGWREHWPVPQSFEGY